MPGTRRANGRNFTQIHKPQILSRISIDQYQIDFNPMLWPGISIFEAAMEVDKP